MSQSLILLKKGRSPAAFLAAAASASVAVVEVPGLPRYYTVADVAPGDLPDTVADHPDVQAVEDGSAEGETDDQDLTIDAAMSNASWALPRIIRRRAPWNVDRIVYPVETFFRASRTGAGVDVYVLDSGFRLDHQEIAGRATNVWEGFSSGGAGDDSGHGTAVASAAAGGTVGFAWGALLWGFKIFDSNVAGTNAVLIAGLGQALLHYQGRLETSRPAVMNISGGGFSDIVSEAVTSCIDAGMVVCVSAGNSRTNLDLAPRYPGQSDPDVILVAGSAMSDTPYHLGYNSRTNYGSAVTVVAPSQTLRIAAHTSADGYRIRSGTSYGVAYVSGVVACMLESRARLIGRKEVQAVKQAVVETATTGRLRPQPQLQIGTLPDRLLYLDPEASQ